MKSANLNLKSFIINVNNSIFICGFLLLIFQTSTFSQTKIEILNADSVVYNRKIDRDLRKLIGNVIILHDSAYMYCDSGYLYKNTNSFEAYSNCHIQQGDTLDLYSDFFEYDGNIKLAKARQNVSLINKEIVLTTHFLDYDRQNSIANYFNHGKIIDTTNILESNSGYYFLKQKEFFYKDSVVVTNPDYVILSDTLKYNTKSQTTYFFGPTEIIGDSNLIYCENGWYNTKTDISQFNKNAYLISNQHKLEGDSLYYNRSQEYGKAFENVTMTDTVENIILKGNYAEYFENSNYAMITDSALLMQISMNDTLFLHADTLLSNYNDTGKFQILQAFYKVKFFMAEMQGKCDSMVFALSDSVIQMHKEPVIWSEENQLTADYMEIHTKNSSPDHIIMEKSAFIISQEDEIRFNQIAGKKMYGHIKNNELYRVDVNGNGQTLYFPKDGNELTGINTADASNLQIFIEDRKIKDILFLTKPDAHLVPIDQLKGDELKLKGFLWLQNHRPLEKYDIFIWND
ncbi:MAG: organic solvent tolerance protein OstA [Bacteroidetes bacterium]|jgi:lipopolysaccharide export system protein LptA|nr:organic solvent tolerance protein OstA [Bacteroidota bacterium]MBT6684821.1 organic solvent tolerance protein OstA [Bacteroidota bacterium]MBT7145181.1 organic solvent tolerance protein OstA [Bacteroidota bacterium]MBT7493207.1 organic solvent tolerance protein OstA [Bacteroidota bacterium]